MSEKIHDNMLMDTQQRKIASKAWAIVHYKLRFGTLDLSRENW